MPIIPNVDRNQIHMLCFEEMVANHSSERLIDAFCYTYKLIELGFVVKRLNHEGRPAFSADTLVRIYIYGCLNKLRQAFNAMFCPFLLSRPILGRHKKLEFLEYRMSQEAGQVDVQFIL